MRTESLPASLARPRSDGCAAAPEADRAARGHACQDAAREPPGRRDAERGASPSFGEAMAVARRAAEKAPAARAQAARDERGERDDRVARPGMANAPGAAAAPNRGDDDATECRADPASADPASADARLASGAPPSQPADGSAAALAPATATATVTAMPPPVACATPPSAPPDAADAPAAGSFSGAVRGKGTRAAACAAAPVPTGESCTPAVTGTNARAATDARAPATEAAGLAGAGVATDAAHPEPAAPDASGPKAPGRAGPDALHRKSGHEPAIAGSGERGPGIETRPAQIGAPAQLSSTDATTSFAMPAPAAAPGTSHAAASPAPPVLASVPTPVGHPGFADRFAGEVGTLALRGIEQAEIVLNPRELGPVRIELSLNGEAARIAFSATQPETRHAIEQTLPVLKDLLASNGLMLAGASVSDGRAGQDAAGGSAFGRTPAPPAASASPGDGGAAPPGTVVARSARLRGLVDLYA